MSKEHVLARWIRKRFPNDGTQEHWHRAELEDGGIQERRFRVVPFELTVRDPLSRRNCPPAERAGCLAVSASGGGRRVASETPAGASARA